MELFSIRIQRTFQLVSTGFDKAGVVFRHDLFQPRAVEGSDRHVEHLLRRAVF